MPTPIAYWKMNDAAGQKVVVDSAGTNTGAAANNIVSVTGKVGNAILFNGTTDLVDCDSATAIDNIFDGGGTVAWWQRVDGQGGANVGRAVGKAQWYASLFGGTSTMRFFQAFSGNNGIWTFPVTPDTLEHIAIVYDSSTTDPPVVYVNSVSVFVTEVIPPTETYSSDDLSDFILGNLAGASNGWDGPLDDVRLYDTELTEAEVKQIYNQAGLKNNWYSARSEFKIR